MTANLPLNDHFRYRDKSNMYEEIEHTADLAIRILSPTLSDLLKEAAGAVMALSGIELVDENGKQESITLKANDPETLLVSWLEELLYAIEVNHLGFRDCQVDIAGAYRLQAAIKLAPIDTIHRYIKAVTFHELSIQRVENGLETVIVFDV